MLTTIKQLQFKAPGTKPVERITHVRPVAKQRECQGCRDKYPSYDMEGDFCTECYIELQGQRLHEQEAAQYIKEF